MRIIMFLSVVAAFGAAALFPVMNSRAADLKAIDELHRKDTKATIEYDVETLSSILAENVVALPPGGAPTLGRARAREGMEKGKAQSSQFEVIEYRQDWQDVEIDGDHAYEWGYFVTAVRPKSGGEVMRNRYKVLRVLARQPDGSWQVLRTMWNEAPRE